eukprot:3168347-Rhodomonas_salina.1
MKETSSLSASLAGVWQTDLKVAYSAVTTCLPNSNLRQHALISPSLLATPGLLTTDRLAKHNKSAWEESDGEFGGE